MSIWILAVLLVAALAYVGHTQGAIRVAFSLLGILVGWIVAVPLAVKVAPMFKKMGFDDPATPLLFGGLLVFILVSAMFKAAAIVMHRKVETHFKHRVGETQMMLWERMNSRVGACLGVANATLYLILISGVIYSFGYWTTQMARADGDPFTLRTLNNAARGLESSGFVRTAGAVTPLNTAYYDAADLAGMLFSNTSAVERLADYPAFLSFAEQPEFQGLRGVVQNSGSVAKFLKEPQVQLVMTNKALFGELNSVVSRDLNDLMDFLKTGKSKKYEGEKILGHWRFSINGTLAQVRASKPDITSKEMAALRLAWRIGFSQAHVIVAPDRQVFVKGLPPVSADPASVTTSETRTLKGQWEESAGGYRMTFEGEQGETRAALQGERLVLTQSGMVLAFNHEK